MGDIVKDIETITTFCCPVCEKSHGNPYGRLTPNMAVCGRDCNTTWEQLGWNEKQKILNKTNKEGS